MAIFYISFLNEREHLNSRRGELTPPSHTNSHLCHLFRFFIIQASEHTHSSDFILFVSEKKSFYRFDFVLGCQVATFSWIFSSY